MHADLVVLGYDGSYGRVAAFVRAWKAERQREQQTSGRGTFVPLVFAAGESNEIARSLELFCKATRKTIGRRKMDRHIPLDFAAKQSMCAAREQRPI